MKRSDINLIEDVLMDVLVNLEALPPSFFAGTTGNEAKRTLKAITNGTEWVRIATKRLAHIPSD